MKAKSKASLITIPAIPALAALAILGICIFENYIVNRVSALEYTTTYNNNFTLRPSISVSLSSASSTSPDNPNNPSGSANLVITDLLPNTSSDSNTIIVNVASNNSSGYVLNSSVGSSVKNTTDLKNEDNNNYAFTSLAYNSSISDLSDFSPNTWGYSYATYNTETSSWNNWSNYSGLPLYNNTNPAILYSTLTPSAEDGDNIRFKIAVKASSTQASGEYTNIINFIAVGNPTPVSFYDAFSEAASQPGSTISQLNGYYKMQDMSSDICSAVNLYDDASHIQLIDTRDNEVYWIGKLKDNRCWLLDNLRLGSDSPITLTSNDTNIITNFILPGSTSIFGTGTAYGTARVNATHKNDTTVSYGSGSGKIGVYYNYCATSAGTYCYGPDSGIDIPDTLIDSPYDICPANWRLPTSGSGGESDVLSSQYPSRIATDSTSLQYNLSISLSGGYSAYQNTQSYLDLDGYFWSSTYATPSSMRKPTATANSCSFSGAYDTRFEGVSIRCIANNE